MSQKSKCSLIIDGNWLLMSRLSVLNNRFKTEKELCQELKLLMLKSIDVVLRQFPIIDNIIFVSDGGSWRNKIEIPQFLQLEGVEYKGNREKSDDINWDLIFAEFEDFMSVLSTTGITVCREQYIEGDDWCWYWSTKLNSENTNCIIWSKDKDLTQLVKTDQDNCFTIWWNKDSGVIVEDKPDEEMNFLMNFKFNENEEIYREILKNCIKITKINPQNIVIDKIIRGDAGDNILPIIFRNSKTNSEKKFRVSVKDLPNNLNIHDKNNICDYISNLLNSKSYIDRVDKPFDNIIEHFEYNVKLVELTKENYPDYIMEIFEKYTEYNQSKDVSVAESKIRASSNQLKEILDFI